MTQAYSYGSCFQDIAAAEEVAAVEPTVVVVAVVRLAVRLAAGMAALSPLTVLATRAYEGDMNVFNMA